MSTAQNMTMADHWWWRPGWRQGRSFYTFHLTFQHATQVHRIAAAYRRALAAVPGLDLVPDQWLHLTMQGLGFTDEVSDTDLNAIIAAARERLRAVPAFDLTLTRPEITPEAIRWEAQPATPTIAVRDALRQAIGAVWPTVPEVADGFAPHVSIAYSNAAGPAGPIADALDQVHEPPAVTPIDRVDLIVLNRDTRMYQWTTHTSIPLR